MGADSAPSVAISCQDKPPEGVLGPSPNEKGVEGMVEVDEGKETVIEGAEVLDIVRGFVKNTAGLKRSMEMTSVSPDGRSMVKQVSLRETTRKGPM